GDGRGARGAVRVGGTLGRRWGGPGPRPRGQRRRVHSAADSAQVVVTPIVARAEEVRAWSAACRRAGRRIALVPTMGALHAGHVPLIEAAGGRAEEVVVSIFVNPTQFGPKEDLARYSRDLAGDVEKSTLAGATLVFAPSAEEMYPRGYQTYV